MISQAKLEFWIKHGYNVLFVGRHGVGKTAIITQAFDKANLRWKYFSAATMDPWVDFIGIPKEQVTAEGVPYIDLVRPLEFQLDQIEALFFDEFNRAHKKVRNAVMELMQFKSINGKKFKNLRIVWAAINPDDEDEYDVERLDPAQKDRFHVSLDIPYKPDLDYFTKVYGADTSRAAISWWNELPVEMKDACSPRRLDYALDILTKQGDVRDVLPPKANVSKLLTIIKTGPVMDRLRELMSTNNKDEARKFVTTENTYAAAVNYIVNEEVFRDYFLPLMSDEKISSLIVAEDAVFDWTMKHVDTNESLRAIVAEILTADQNKALTKKLKKALASHPDALNALNVGFITSGGEMIGHSTPDKPKFNTHAGAIYTPSNPFRAATDLWKNQLGKRQQTYDRKKVLEDMARRLPLTMTSAEAVEVLKILALICKKSHLTTLKNSIRLNGMVGMANHAIDQIAKNENIHWPEIYKKYGGAFPDLLNKLCAAGHGGKILCPRATGISTSNGSSIALPTKRGRGRPPKVPVATPVPAPSTYRGLGGKSWTRK